jgi:hypothetical protein
LIVQSAKSFTASQSNAMASRKVPNSQLMSGLLNAWDVAHLASSWSMMIGLRSYQMATYEFNVINAAQWQSSIDPLMLMVM